MPEQQIETQPPPARPMPSSAAEVKPRTDATTPDAPNTNGTSAAVDANYQYWREHGGEWADGYDQRKKKVVLYHIQELMLTQYMLEYAQSAPEQRLSVLEFGCGVGRHLRNLTRLPGVDAYGYDQSHTMAQGILRWAGKAWFDSHITVGMPTGTLPYPDKHFDIVYTAEVLVHVRPEHLDGILKELVRISRGHVLHMETSEHYSLVSDSHNGCWGHDMVAAYARLGLECELLPSGYRAHTPYRVLVGQEPRFTWPPAILEMYRRLERDINEGFSAEAAAAHHRQQRVQELQASVMTLTESAGAHASRAEGLGAQLQQSRASEAQLAAECKELERAGVELKREIAALAKRAAEFELLWGQEKQQAKTLEEQRNRFVAVASTHLRK